MKLRGDLPDLKCAAKERISLLQDEGQHPRPNPRCGAEEKEEDQAKSPEN